MNKQETRAGLREQIVSTAVDKIVAAVTAEQLDQLQAEIDECAIWLDSGNGPSPSRWTDEMWAYYVRSRTTSARKSRVAHKAR